MRTVGHIDHPKYKITVLAHNNKLTLQIEFGLLSQSYSFRDGSTVSNMTDVQTFCNSDFLAKIDARFDEMNKDYFAQMSKSLSDEFPTII